VLAPPIASIFNASLQQASVPITREKADFKAPSDISKDLLSKMCERFVADWLMELIRARLINKNSDP
jgi:hypothetical protein